MLYLFVSFHFVSSNFTRSRQNVDGKIRHPKQLKWCQWCGRRETITANINWKLLVCVCGVRGYSVAIRDWTSEMGEKRSRNPSHGRSSEAWEKKTQTIFNFHIFESSKPINVLVTQIYHWITFHFSANRSRMCVCVLVKKKRQLVCPIFIYASFATKRCRRRREKRRQQQREAKEKRVRFFFLAQLRFDHFHPFILNR